jgi:hypothetical protein
LHKSFVCCELHRISAAKLSQRSLGADAGFPREYSGQTMNISDELWGRSFRNI